VPIAGLTGQVRALRTAKLKLGYVKKGESFPRDADVFIGKKSDGVTPEMIAAYHATPIDDAKEEGVYRFGDELRGMLAFEYDATDPAGREVVLELLNRSWAASRIRCSGTGGSDEEPGVAWVRDQRYHDRLQKAGLLLGERKGGWEAICHGKDCPLWYDEASKEDKLRGCHREMRLRFILLDPSRFDHRRSPDEQDEDYLLQLGWIEVATGSWNGAVDVQSGLRIVQALAGGRTQFIPFRLRRMARSVSAPGGRVVKHTLLVDHDADEVLIMAGGRGARSRLRPKVRRQLAELDRLETGQAALPPATYADVADIQPQPDRLALPPGRPLAEPAPRDREDALAQADTAAPATPVQQEVPEQGPPAGPAVRLLDREEIAALKVACGGVPGKRDQQGRFRELLEAAYLELGVPADESGHIDLTCREWRPYVAKEGRSTADTPSAWVTTRHREWIEARLADVPVVQGDLLTPEGQG
jgi:hypothetical protein